MSESEALLIWEDIKAGRKTVKEIRALRSSVEKQNEKAPMSACRKFISSINKNISFLDKHAAEITKEEYSELQSLKLKIDQLLNRSGL